MSSGCLPETKNKPTHISDLKSVHGHLRNLRSGQLREFTAYKTVFEGETEWLFTKWWSLMRSDCYDRLY